MTDGDRDSIDRLGRLLVVLVLVVLVVPLAIGIVLDALGLSLRPVYALLLSTTIVYGWLYSHYGQHPHRVV